MNNPNNPVNNRRPPVMDSTEFNMFVTKGTWSDTESNPLFDHQTTIFIPDNDEKGVQKVDAKGNLVYIFDRLIHHYGMFTADYRFGNLDREEVDYVREHSDLAYDLSLSGHKKAHVTVHERGISCIETSHSKNGWYRKMMATITMENKTEYSEPKKSFMGGNKQ
jgi:hypothetical protein